MPPRPRAPRPRVSTIRRPRVAGTAPAAQHTAVADRAAPDAAAADDATTYTAPIAVGPVLLTKPSAPQRPAPKPVKPATEEAAEKEAAEKPSAARRRRRGLGRKAAADAPAAVVPEPSADPAPDRRSRRSLLVPLLAAALVVLTGLAVFFGIADARLRGTPSAANTALVDVGATAEVSGQLTDALQTIYSYDFARLDENERAARAVITPEFADQFNQLFAQVRQLAPQQQAVVTATVTVSAVKEITGDRAVLVAFMDQQATRAAASGGQPTQFSAAGRLTVTGQKVDGRWKIAAVESK
jgi:Mce-associated membrane protein